MSTGAIRGGEKGGALGVADYDSRTTDGKLGILKRDLLGIVQKERGRANIVLWKVVTCL